VRVKKIVVNQTSLKLYIPYSKELKVKNLMKLICDNNTYYFKVIEICIDINTSYIILEEFGNWRNKLRVNDYNNLLNLIVEKITDSEKINKIEEESTYC
jgi:hypothetical protein